MTREPLFPYTDAALETARMDLHRQFPEADDELIAYGVASEAIINVLGPGWWADRLAGERTDPFFLKDGAAGVEAYKHQARVISLAKHLLICQWFEGFAEQRQLFASRSLLAVFHELRAAHLLHENGHHVAFVREAGKKGSDFDLCVDGRLAVEVKAKEDTTAYRRSTLKRTLESEARAQLPKSGPGLIVLCIPDKWGLDQTFAAEADELFRGVLFNTERVNGIVVLWEEWLEGVPSGAACLTRFRVYEHPNPRTDFPDVPRILRTLAYDGSLQNADMEFDTRDWTFACAVRRHAGPGPLLESLDGGLQMVFDRGGFIAARVGGQIFVTKTRIETINGRWMNIAFRFGPAGVDLRIDDEIIGAWRAPAALEHKGLRMCPGVDADLREHLVYANRLADRDLDGLFGYLSAKSGGSYVQFRRGDSARFRTAG